MKAVIFAAVVSFLSGCSVTPVKAPISTTVTDRITVMEVYTDKIKVQPLPDTSSKPQKVITPSGEAFAGFNAQQLNALKELRIAAEANTLIAEELLSTHTALVNNRNTIAELAKIEEARANFMAEKWAEAETDLKQEKRDHFINLWGQRLLILLGIIATGI